MVCEEIVSNGRLMEARGPSSISLVVYKLCIFLIAYSKHCVFILAYLKLQTIFISDHLSFDSRPSRPVTDL